MSMIPFGYVPLVLSEHAHPHSALIYAKIAEYLIFHRHLAHSV